MSIFKHLSVAAVAVAALAMSPAQANVASGQLWHIPEAIAQNAIPSNVPGTTPDVTFDVNSPFNFTTAPSVGGFLATSAAFNIVENTPGTLASLLDNFIEGTLIQFLGQVTVTSGQQFTVTHDDGLSLIIGGINLGFSTGPTAPVTSVATYNGPSGTFPFQLVYGECCGGAAVLQVDLPFVSAPPIPEPQTYALMLAGLGVLAFVRRRAGKA